MDGEEDVARRIQLGAILVSIGRNNWYQKWGIETTIGLMDTLSTIPTIVYLMGATMFLVILTNVNFTEDVEDGIQMNERLIMELNIHSQPVEDMKITRGIIFRILE